MTTTTTANTSIDKETRKMMDYIGKKYTGHSGYKIEDGKAVFFIVELLTNIKIPLDFIRRATKEDKQVKPVNLLEKARGSLTKDYKGNTAVKEKSASVIEKRERVAEYLKKRFKNFRMVWHEDSNPDYIAVIGVTGSKVEFSLSTLYKKFLDSNQQELGEDFEIYAKYGADKLPVELRA